MANYRTRMARGERGVIAPEPVKRYRRRKDSSATAAARLGIPVETYRANRADGLKWCSGHKDWHVVTSTPFPRHQTTGDGLAGTCTAWFREYMANKRRSA